MGDVTELKGLSDLKTSITAHVRSKPPQEGTEYLELYLAEKEKKRQEKMTQTWEKHKRRSLARHAEVLQSIAKLEKKVGLEKTSGQDPVTEPAAEDRQAAQYPDYSRRRWKKMTLDY